MYVRMDMNKSRKRGKENRKIKFELAIVKKKNSSSICNAYEHMSNYKWPPSNNSNALRCTQI